jgi:hypothetical protein
MFPLFGFSIQELFICYFYCQKMAFVCEFQHTPLRKIIFLATLHNFGKYEILPHVPNSTRNKNMKSGKPYLSPKMVCLAPKTLLYLSGTAEKNFFFGFEPYDLANSKE